MGAPWLSNHFYVTLTSFRPMDLILPSLTIVLWPLSAPTCQKYDLAAPKPPLIERTTETTSRIYSVLRTECFHQLLCRPQGGTADVGLDGVCHHFSATHRGTHDGRIGFARYITSFVYNHYHCYGPKLITWPPPRLDQHIIYIPRTSNTGSKDIPLLVVVELQPNVILQWRNMCSHLLICTWSRQRWGIGQDPPWPRKELQSHVGLFLSCSLDSARGPYGAHHSGSTGGLWIEQCKK